MFDKLMYLLLCISVNIRVVYRERAWLLGKALSLYIERAWFLRSGMVFVQRKGMAFRVGHGLCTEKGQGLLVQAWSFYTIQSPTVMFSFFHCLGSHYDYCLSCIVCALKVEFIFFGGPVISVEMKHYATLFPPVLKKLIVLISIDSLRNG